MRPPASAISRRRHRRPRRRSSPPRGRRRSGRRRRRRGTAPASRGSARPGSGDSGRRCAVRSADRRGSSDCTPVHTSAARAPPSPTPQARSRRATRRHRAHAVNSSSRNGSKIAPATTPASSRTAIDVHASGTPWAKFDVPSSGSTSHVRLAALGRPSLLADDRVLRVVAGDHPLDLRLGGDVDGGHQRRAFVLVATSIGRRGRRRARPGRPGGGPGDREQLGGEGSHAASEVGGEMAGHRLGVALAEALVVGAVLEVVEVQARSSSGGVDVAPHTSSGRL